MKTNKNYLFNSIAIIFLALSLIFQALTISKLTDRIEKLEEVKSIEVNKNNIIENDPPISIIPNEFYLGSIAIPWARTVYTAGDDAAIHYVSWNYTIGVFADMDGENIIIDYVNLSLSYEVYVTGLAGSTLFRTYRFDDILSFDFDFGINKLDNDTFYFPLIMAQLDFNTGDVLASFGLLNTQRQLIDDTKVFYAENTIFNDIITFVNMSYSSAKTDLISIYGQLDSETQFDYIDMYFNLDQQNNYTCPYFLPFSNNIFNSLVVTVFGSNGEGGGGGADEGYTQADLDQAYNSGFQAGEKSKNTFTLSWLGDIFDVVGQILSVEIFYGFKLWYFVGIIGIIGVIYGVMKLWR